MSQVDFRVVSLYWNNVDPRLVAAQKLIFASLNIELDQQLRHGLEHGEWMQEQLNSTGDDHVLIIVDIDCAPLNTAVLDRAVLSARSGKVFGCAQAANHRDKNAIYAGPMFLALSGATWRRLGCPSLRADKSFDVGGRLTHAAQLHGVDVELLYPSEVAVPKWNLGQRGVFGLFTVYEGSVVHLFESRNKALLECFVELSDALSRARSTDYRKYVLQAVLESRTAYAREYLEKNSLWGKVCREARRLRKRFR